MMKNKLLLISLKKIIAITLSLFVFSCSMFKDSEPVEHLMIRTYLLENGVHNYEPVLFSIQDSAFTSVKSEKEYQRLWGIASLNEVLEHQYKFTDSQQSKQYADSARKYQLKCDFMEKAFQPQFKGWKIHHETFA